MQQITERGLLWLPSVSPPSAVSQSHLNAESQKRAEISRGDLEDKAHGNTAITQDSQCYYVRDCLIPKIWALRPVRLPASLGCGHFIKLSVQLRQT